MEKPLNILLIRHGEVEYPLDREGKKLVYGTDTPLSETGRNQIQKLSSRIKEEQLAVRTVFTSPFLRARETAVIFSRNLSLPEPIIIESLQDVHNPDWVGIPLEEYGINGGDIYNNPKSSNQESLEQLIQRAKNALSEIFSREGTGDHAFVALVSHGDLLSALHWGLTHTDNPQLYRVMKKNFYLPKGGAYRAVLDEYNRLVGEGLFITTEEAEQTRETWR